MMKNAVRHIVLAMGASALAMSVALADPGNGQGNGNGNGGGHGNNGGGNSGNGGGNNGNGGGNGGSSGGSDGGSSGGGDSGGSSGGSGDSGGGGGDSGSSGGSGGSSGSSSSADSGSSSGAPASAPSSVTATIDDERDSATKHPSLQATLPPIEGWALTDFYGMRVNGPSGDGIGTIEGVMVDPGDFLYLVTSLDGQDVDGHERVIQLSRFDVDPRTQSLVLDDATVALLPKMADLADVASVFTAVDNDEKLQALLAAH